MGSVILDDGEEFEDTPETWLEYFVDVMKPEIGKGNFDLILGSLIDELQGRMRIVAEENIAGRKRVPIKKLQKASQKDMWEPTPVPIFNGTVDSIHDLVGKTVKIKTGTNLSPRTLQGKRVKVVRAMQKNLKVEMLDDTRSIRFPKGQIFGIPPEFVDVKITRRGF